MNALVGGYLFAIAYWAVPLGWPLKDQINPLLGKVIYPVGLAQWWDMFAPNPMSSNEQVSARLEFASGKKTVWIFPRKSKMSQAETYYHERYGKWAERVSQDGYSALWPAAARFVARKFSTPADAVIRVTLVRERSDIKAPQGGVIPPIDPDRFDRREEYYRFDLRTGVGRPITSHGPGAGGRVGTR